MAHCWNAMPAPFLDANGDPYSGAKTFFFVGPNTSTPLATYSDYALSTPNDHPVVANASGVFPPVYIADDTQYRVRITSSDGATVIADNAGITTPPAATEEGGGASGDTIPTGSLFAVHQTGALTGYVRANGNTIGSAASGGTERANADTEDLFTLLWADTSLTVSGGGRGANAASDFAAGKTITLPDYRGCTIVGLDGMGASRANRLSDGYFDTDGDTLNAFGGAEEITLTEAQLPSVTATTTSNGAHVHEQKKPGALSSAVSGGALAILDNYTTGVTDSGIDTKSNGAHTHNVSFGSDAAHENLQPSRLATIYIKL